MSPWAARPLLIAMVKEGRETLIPIFRKYLDPEIHGLTHYTSSPSWEGREYCLWSPIMRKVVSQDECKHITVHEKTTVRNPVRIGKNRIVGDLSEMEEVPRKRRCRQGLNSQVSEYQYLSQIETYKDILNIDRETGITYETQYFGIEHKIGIPISSSISDCEDEVVIVLLGRLESILEAVALAVSPNNKQKIAGQIAKNPITGSFIPVVESSTTTEASESFLVIPCPEHISLVSKLQRSSYAVWTEMDTVALKGEYEGLTRGQAASAIHDSLISQGLIYGDIDKEECVIFSSYGDVVSIKRWVGYTKRRR